jgi:hypothetical protein
MEGLEVRNSMCKHNTGSFSFTRLMVIYWLIAGVVLATSAFVF